METLRRAWGVPVCPWHRPAVHRLDLRIFPPGGSGKFIQVIEVPAAYTALELGLYFRSPKRIAWYDLRSEELKSAFASPDGLTALQTAKIPAGSTLTSTDSHAYHRYRPPTEWLHGRPGRKTTLVSIALGLAVLYCGTDLGRTALLFAIIRRFLIQQPVAPGR